MESLLKHTGDRYGLVIHIGCSEAAAQYWRERADRVVLVEPDPLRANGIRAWLEEGGSGTLIEAAVADRRGESAFRRTSFGDMNSLRVPTGALTLFPGLQSLETVPVKLIQPRDLVSGLDLDKIEGRIGLVIDAPSEVLIVLTDLYDAGVLEKFDDIILRVADIPLHEGGADRKCLDAWLDKPGYRLSWDADSLDPDVRYALVKPDWKVRNVQNKRRVVELENTISRLQQSKAEIAKEAQTNYSAFEKARQDRDALKKEVEGMRQSYASVSEEAQANYSAFEKAQQDRDALKKEVEELTVSLNKSTEEAQRAHRLRSELEFLRDDNRLSLRIQRIAQADLADLQDRYGSLAEEKRKLENFLDALAEKVQQSMRDKEAVEPENKPKATRSRIRSSKKPAQRRSRSQPT